MTATGYVAALSGSAVLSGVWLAGSLPPRPRSSRPPQGSIRVLHSRIFGGAADDLEKHERNAVSRSGFLRHRKWSDHPVRSPRASRHFRRLHPPCGLQPRRQLYVDTSNNARLCACTASNSWQCAALRRD